MNYDVKIEMDSKIIYANINKNSNSFNGYIISSNKIEVLNEDIFKYLNILFLSNNNKQIKSKNGIDYFKDLNTGFIFPYKKNKIDIDLFLKMNASPVEALYLLNSNRKGNNNRKIVKYVFKTLLFTITITSMLLANLETIYIINNRIPFSQIIDQSVGSMSSLLNNINVLKSFELCEDDIYNAINNSKITEDEKELLYNDDYFKLILPYLNQNMLKANEIYFLLSQINILYVETDFDGYVYEGDPTIYISNRKKDADSINNIMLHEFIHQTQPLNKYSILLEATDALMSKEFYNIEINDNADNVKVIKLLTNILGPETILKLVYSNDIAGFTNELSKYLFPEDVKSLCQLLDTYSINATTEQYISINKLIAKMYYNKYGKDICLDSNMQVIINNNDRTTTYFNKLIKYKRLTIGEVFENKYAIIINSIPEIYSSKNNNTDLLDEENYYIVDNGYLEKKCYKIIHSTGEYYYELSRNTKMSAIPLNENIKIYEDDSMNYDIKIILIENIEEKKLTM